MENPRCHAIDFSQQRQFLRILPPCSADHDPCAFFQCKFICSPSPGRVLPFDDFCGDSDLLCHLYRSSKVGPIGIPHSERTASRLISALAADGSASDSSATFRRRMSGTARWTALFAAGPPSDTSLSTASFNRFPEPAGSVCPFGGVAA